MPVEIRELFVRATVPGKDRPGAQPVNAGPQAKAVDHAAVVEECVAAVMRILEKKERR